MQNNNNNIIVQVRKMTGRSHGTNSKTNIPKGGRDFVKNNLNKHSIPDDISDLDDEYYDKDNDGYAFCVCKWNKLNNIEKNAERANNKTYIPDANDVVIACSYNKEIVSGMCYVVLNSGDNGAVNQWQNGGENFRKSVLKHLRDGN